MKRKIEEIYDLYKTRGQENNVMRILALISSFSASVKENSTVHPGYILSMVKQAEDVILLQKIFIDLLFEDVHQGNIPAREYKHTTISL